MLMWRCFMTVTRNWTESFKFQFVCALAHCSLSTVHPSQACQCQSCSDQAKRDSSKCCRDLSHWLTGTNLNDFMLMRNSLSNSLCPEGTGNCTGNCSSCYEAQWCKSLSFNSAWLQVVTTSESPPGLLGTVVMCYITYIFINVHI